MISEKEKIDSILANPEEMEKLSKEELVQIMRAKETIEKNLSDILPALNAKRDSEYVKMLDGVDENVKEFLTKEVFPNVGKDEVEPIIQFAKSLIEVIQKGQKPADANPNPDG